MEAKTDKVPLTKEILSILKESAEEHPEGYTCKEWIEAAELMPDDTFFAIPWCVWDLVVDEFGVPKMESKYDNLGRRRDLDDEGNVDPEWTPMPKRWSRNDILAILTWIPLKREDPDLTLDDVEKMLNDKSISKITRMVFKFWGVNLAEAEERLAELMKQAESESGDESKDVKQEAEKNGNFSK